MSDVFISYAKADNEDFKIVGLQERLSQTPSLINPEKSITVWFDENNIRASEHWADEIGIALEQAHVVAVFVSPRYFASLVCNQELQRAQELGKKIVPVWIQAVSAGGIEAEIAVRHSQHKATATLHEALRNYASIENNQAIRYDTDTSPNRQRSFERLVTAIFEHARLDDGAREWLERLLAKERKTGSWITGADLKQAENWLKEAEKTPNFVIHPATRRFIVQSRRANTQRQVLGGVISLIALFLIGMAVQEAQRQSVIAEQERLATAQEQARNTSQQLANQALSLLGEQNPEVELATLLSIHALKTAYTPQADTALNNSILQLYSINQFAVEPLQETFISTVYRVGISALALSSDNQHALIGTNKGELNWLLERSFAHLRGMLRQLSM